ncbi:MAG: PAS domain-containing protein [Gammaproteobacteria bacterium]|nr:PAS domain-containing protein [Gammaproteobacteria bacterium]
MSGVLSITFIYIIGATVWIYFSDLLLKYVISDPSTLIVVSIFKGWMFVAITAFLLYKVLHRYTRQDADQRLTLAPGRSKRVLQKGIIAALVIGLGAGFILINGLQKQHDQQLQQQLLSFARMQADSVLLWRKNIQRNGEALAGANFLSSALSRWLQNADQESKQQVLMYLQSMHQMMDYSAIALFNRSGELLLRVPALGQASEQLARSVRHVFETDEVQFTDFYRTQTDNQQSTQLDVVIPVTLPSLQQQVALVLQLDVINSQFPVLSSGSLLGHSVERYLYKLESDDVLFLNEAAVSNNKRLEGGADSDTTDLSELKLAAAGVNSAGFFETLDKQNRSIIGVALAISGTAWHLMVKVDRAQLDEALHSDILWASLVLILGMISMLAGVLLWDQFAKLQLAALQQRKQAEESLDLIFQSLPDLYLRVATDTTILDARAHQSLDYSMTPDLCGKKLQDVFPSDVVASFESGIQKVRREGDSHSFEYRIKLPRGERHFEARLAGKLASDQIIVLIRDITQQLKIKHELQKHEEKLSRVLDGMLEGCQILDFEWRYLYVNAEAAKHGLKSREELLGQRIMDVYPGIENTELFSKLRECMETRQPHRMENKFVYPDQSVGYFELHIQPVDQGIFILSLDNSARKQAEEQLMKNQRRLRTLIETLPDLIWLKDQDGAYLFCNAEFEQFFGAAEAAIIGKTDFDFVDQALANSFRENDKAAMAAGHSCMNEEEVTYASDGHTALLETIKTPLYGESGELIGVLGIARDISGRKQDENKLKEQLQGLTRMHQAMLGREGRVMELKKEVNQLADLLGRPLPYSSVKPVEQEDDPD